MNDLQKKTFELLLIFDDICKKWDIPFFLICGSALGAVKYGGFIPWDDDIDVGLMREDYQRFLKIALKELPEWCFLQNYQTEPMFPHTFSKLRNSETTFIETSLADLPMNHGIYVDIFPIDGHPIGFAETCIFRLKKKWNDWVRFSVIKNTQSSKVQLRNRILRFFGCHKRIQTAQIALEKLYSSFPPEASDIWCNYGNWQGNLEYAPRWHYGKGTWTTFEGMPVRIPENYDAYLTQKYGDWRSDPPIKRQKSHHITTIVDTGRSYREYL